MVESLCVSPVIGCLSRVYVPPDPLKDKLVKLMDIKLLSLLLLLMLLEFLALGGGFCLIWKSTVCAYLL